MSTFLPLSLESVKITYIYKSWLSIIIGYNDRYHSKSRNFLLMMGVFLIVQQQQQTTTTIIIIINRKINIFNWFQLN